MSDESYNTVDANSFQPKNPMRSSRRPEQPKSNKRTFDYKCGGHNEPVGEMCCYKIKHVTVEDSSRSNNFNEDVSNSELNDDNYLHKPQSDNTFCHRVQKETPKSGPKHRRRGKNLVVLTLFIITQGDYD